MNLNNLDLNKLAVFSKVVAAGNYRKASDELHVTPSALSQAIASLEHSLGIPLFYRIGKKLVLTEMGAKIQREFEAHHSSLTRGLSRIADRDQSVSGLLRIGAYLEFAKTQLAPILAAFQKKHPNVQVKLTFDTPTRLHRMLEEGKLDFCFSIYPEHRSQSIQSQPIYHEELLLVAPRGILSERARYEEVVVVPMIEYYFNHQPLRRWLMHHFKRRPRTLPIRAYGATAEMVLALVQEGLGAGVVPEYLLQPKVRRGLVLCRPTPRKLMDHIWMLQSSDQAKPTAQRLFAHQVLKTLTTQ